ncbi:DUF1015 family protein [Erysipelothrix anatis]|uniref:DUF1015 family protein n=1 Tax=Erysipelothrix anatis TaxID=2683713 RepID=UPI00140D5896|nr:DUF1015 family protein [Erysipelothrix anatis]
MKLSPLKKSHLNVSGHVYGPDFINLAKITDDCINFDEKTRFLNQDEKDILNEQAIVAYENVVYIVERDGKYCVICNVDMSDYTDGNLITHELVLPDIIQGMLSNLKAYNAETAPVFLMSPTDLQLKDIVETFDHETVQIEAMAVHIFKEPNAKRIMQRLSSIETLIVGDGHHRLYTSSLWRRKGTIFSCLMSMDDIEINSIDRMIPDVDDALFSKAMTFIQNQFEVSDASGPLTKGMIRVSRGTESVNVKLIDLESDDFWNNDVYRLNTQILSQAFGIYDTSQLEYYISSKSCKDKCKHNIQAVQLELAPISKEEVLFVSSKRAIMPPKSTAFDPKFPSFLIFNEYQ